MSTVKFKPDRVKYLTKSQAEEYFQWSFKFSGPGWYKLQTDNNIYLLVIPCDRESEDIWSKSFPNTEIFEFNIYYNVNPLAEFAKLRNVPIHELEKDKWVEDYQKPT